MANEHSDLRGNYYIASVSGAILCTTTIDCMELGAAEEDDRQPDACMLLGRYFAFVILKLRRKP